MLHHLSSVDFRCIICLVGLFILGFGLFCGWFLTGSSHFANGDSLFQLMCLGLVWSVNQ